MFLKDMHGCMCTCCKDVQLHSNHRFRRHSLRAESADLYQMFPTTKDSCSVNRTFICNHLSPHHPGK